MHHYLVISITTRGKYSIAGASTKEMAQAIHARVSKEHAVYDVVIVDSTDDLAGIWKRMAS